MDASIDARDGSVDAQALHDLLHQPEIAQQRRGVRVAMLRLLGEQALDDDLTPLFAVRHGRQRRRAAVENRGDLLGGRRALERPAAAQHFVEQHAERIQIGALIEALAEQLLGRHVVDRARRVMRLRDRERAGRIEPREMFRESEVEELHDAVVGHEDVGRLDVAVHDEARVRALQTFGHLHGDVENARRLALSAREPPLHRLAFEQFHDDERPAAVVADVEDAADGGVAERRGRTGFALEAQDGDEIVADLRRQHLDRHGPLLGEVVGLVDHAHSAAAEFLKNSISATELTKKQGRGSLRRSLTWSGGRHCARSEPEDG